MPDSISDKCPAEHSAICASFRNDRPRSCRKDSMRAPTRIVKSRSPSRPFMLPPFTSCSGQSNTSKNPLPRADRRRVICCPSELPRSAPGIGWGHAATFAVPRGFACNVLARQTHRQPCKPSANGEPRSRQRNQRRAPQEVTTFCNFFQTATATSAASPPQCLARPSARAAPSPSPAAE